MAAKKTSAATAVETAVVTANGRRSRTASNGTARSTSSGKKTTAAKTATKSATKPPAKKSPAKKTAAKQAPAKKAPAKKAPARKAPAKKAPAKKAPAKKVAAKKVAAKQTSPKKTATGTAVKRAGAAKTTAGAPRLAVREGERPWTAKEIAEVRHTLESDRDRLREEIAAAEEEISHLLREGGEGAGHDQADVGSTTFERDHEMSMAKNARDNLRLVEDALGRIDDGTYGVCASCGRPIGKLRLQAFPRATLCMECKQRQERR